MKEVATDNMQRLAERRLRENERLLAGYERSRQVRFRQIIIRLTTDAQGSIFQPRKFACTRGGRRNGIKLAA